MENAHSSPENCVESPKQKTFLEIPEADDGSSQSASKAAGIARQTHYNRMDEDDGYRQRGGRLKDESDEQANLSSPVYFREWFRVIERQWSADLPTSAKAIVWMVFDRTLGWGKEWERIPLRHFTDGVKRVGQDEYTHPGTGMNRSTVREWLGILVKAGVLRREGDSHYALNYEWNPQPITRNMREPKKDRAEKRKGGLAEPKNGRKTARSPWADEQESVQDATEGGVEFPPKGVEFPPKGGGISTPIREGKEREGKIKRDTAPPRGGELEANLKKLQTKADAKVTARRTKAEDNIPPSKQVGQLFDDLRLASFPDSVIPATRNVDSAILKKYAFRWCRRADAERRVPYSAFKDYLEWVASHWTTLMLNRFAWMKDTPPFPDVRFLVGLSDHFVRAYEDKRRIDEFVGLTPKQSYILDLRHDGVSQAEAEAAAEERFKDKHEADRLRKERLGLQKARLVLEVAKDKHKQAGERKRAAMAREKRIEQYQSNPASNTGRFTWKEDDL